MGAAGKRRVKNKMGNKEEVLCPSHLCPSPLKQPPVPVPPSKKKKKTGSRAAILTAPTAQAGAQVHTALMLRLPRQRNCKQVDMAILFLSVGRDETGFPDSPLLLSSIPGCFALPKQRLSYRQPLSLAPFLLCCGESGKEHTGVCLQPKHACSCPQLPRPCKPGRAGGGRQSWHWALVGPFQAQSAVSSSIQGDAL